jgi:hypothetical protein
MGKRINAFSVRSTARGRGPLRLEPLEDRCVLSVDMVTNLSGDPNVAGTLPFEIAQAQAGDKIQFQTRVPGYNRPRHRRRSEGESSSTG